MGDSTMSPDDPRVSSDDTTPRQPSASAEEPVGRMTRIAAMFEHWHDPEHPFKRAWWGLAFVGGMGLIREMDGQKRPSWLVGHVLLLAWAIPLALVRPPRPVWLMIASWTAFAVALSVGVVAAVLGFR